MTEAIQSRGSAAAPEQGSGAAGAPPAPRDGGSGFAGGWRGARRLLHGPFRMLVAGQGSGQLADGLAQISFAQLVLFEVGRGATPARIATVLAATLLPFSVVGPLAGVFIDRWDRRRTLVVTSWLRAALALAGIATALSGNEIAAYAGVILLLSSSRFVLDGKGSVLPRTVPAADLVRANALSGLIGMTASFLGGVGGAMFVSASVSLGFLAAAVGYVVAALCFARLPFEGGGHPAERLGAALGALARDLWAGVQVTAHTSALRRPLVAVWTHRLLLGGGFIVLVLVADSRYHLTVAGYGLALAVTGVAAFLGTITAPYLVRRWRPYALLPLAFLPPAAAAVVAGYYPSLPALLAAVGVTAFSFQCLKVLTDALVGRAAPDAVRGRVFALYDVLYNVAFVAAGLLMVPLWQPGAERGLLWLFGCLYAAGWLVFSRMVRSWPYRGAAASATGAVGAGAAWRTRGLALLAGALPVLIFPKPSLGWLAWVVLVPWLLLLRSAPSPRRAVTVGWWGGIGFILAVHYWLLPSTTVMLPLIAAFLGAFWIPWAVVGQRLLAGPLTGRRLAAAVVVVPAAWLLVEAIRSASGLGGPWGLLGASQWNLPAFLSTASLGGAWLVSFLIVAANVAVLALLAARRWTLRAAAALVAATAVLAGPVWYALAPRPGDAGVLRVATVSVGVIHQAAPRLEAAVAATERLPAGRFDLIVWGESSVGFDLARRPDITQRLQALSARTGADLLVNVDARAASGAIQKMAVLVGPDGVRDSYAKMRLVPFGEYIPLRPVFGWLGSVSKAAAADRVRGTELAVMRAPAASGPVAVTPLICFEGAFPDLSRTAARSGADVVVVQSSTTTFQGMWTADQLASLAAVRAVESGRPVAQGTLSDTSAAFAARGERIAWHPQPTGTVAIDLPRAAWTTPYDVAGDWVLAASFAILAAGALALGLRSGRADEAPAAEAEPAEPVGSGEAAAVGSAGGAVKSAG